MGHGEKVLKNRENEENLSVLAGENKFSFLLEKKKKNEDRNENER